MSRIILFILFSLSIISSCKNQDTAPANEATPQPQQPAADPIQQNIQDIEAYLKTNNIKAEKTASNIYYTVTKEGDGTHPVLADEVTVHYKGYFLNGEQFDSSYDRGEPTSFPLSRVVQGWQEGIPLFSRGGAGTIFLPSNLGYGSYPPPGIPPNSVLIFDVELIKINNQ